MARTGRKDSDVTGFHLDSPALESPELHLALTAGNSEHLMNARVIVDVIIYSVAPGVAPTVAFKQLLKYGGRIEVVVAPHDAAINDERPMGMIGDDSIVLEAEELRFS